MKRNIVYIILILIVIAAAWVGIHTLMPKKKVPLRLDSISLDKKAFDPDAGESARIRYKASKKCSSTITICNEQGVPVKTLIVGKSISSKPQYVTWNGLNDENKQVPGGVYFYVIELEAGKENFLYNPYKRTHGINLKSVTGSYDRQKGEINYSVPQAARVRIRVGLKDGGPLLVTPLDWTTKTAGKYSVNWDGKDASGNIDLSSHPKRNLVIFAYTLADNSIIVTSPRKTSLKSDVNKPVLFSTKLALDRSIHARNYFRMSHEPRISMEFQGAFKKTTDGIPVVKGVVPAKISIAPKDKLALENSRYELMFYVDMVFLFEEEAGFSPFTYMWDTRGLREGEHLFTVNLWSYDDNCGVITKKVFVKREENEKL